MPVLKGDFIWDDDLHVTENPHVKSLHGLKRIWFDIGATPQYYPMVYTVFWGEYRLWGLKPLGYHAVNIFLHFLNAFLLWLVLRRLNVRGALIAATVFAVHPVHVETVAWISEHKNTVSAFFYLASALAFLGLPTMKSHPENREPSPNKDLFVLFEKYPAWGLYTLSLLLFLFALFSKTVTCTLPAALLLLMWWKRGRLRLRDAGLLLPFFILSAVFGFITVWMELNVVGAQGEEWGLSLTERVLVAGRALWFYAGKLIFPHNLTFIYPRWEMDVGIWWQYLFPLAAVAAAAALWLMRHRIGRGPLTAVLFFAGTLTPALGFFNVYPHRFSFVADHFQYLASIGIIALVVSILTRILTRFGSVSKRAPTAFLSMVVVLLGFLTWKQGRIYGDIEVLYRDTIAKNPRCWMAHNNLGNVLWQKSHFDEGIAHLRAALNIRPNYGEAHNNLGNAFAAQGKIADAIRHYEEALEIDPDNAYARNNLGVGLAKQGKYKEAAIHLIHAVKLRPQYADAFNNLGNVMGKLNNLEEAVRCYGQAVKLKPSHSGACYSLANTLVKLGRLEEASRHYARVIRLDPGHAGAHYNMGNLMVRAGNLDGAVSYYSEAIRIKPGFAEAHNNLGLAFARKGDRTRAIRHFRLALQIKPGLADARRNLERLSRSKDM